MKTSLPLLLVLGLSIDFFGCRPGGGNVQAEGREKDRTKTATDESKTKTEGMMELVGTLRRPSSPKQAYRLEIYPAGNLKVIEMLGDVLRKVPDRTPVRVRGVVRSQVVGPAKDDPAPYPIQWGVWLRVAEVQTFATVEEAFRELRERHLEERDRSPAAK